MVFRTRRCRLLTRNMCMYIIHSTPLLLLLTYLRHHTPPPGMQLGPTSATSLNWCRARITHAPTTNAACRCHTNAWSFRIRMKQGMYSEYWSSEPLVYFFCSGCRAPNSSPATSTSALVLCAASRHFPFLLLTCNVIWRGTSCTQL